MRRLRNRKQQREGLESQDHRERCRDQGGRLDLEGAFTFTGARPPTPPAGGPRTLKFEPTVFHNYFAWNIAPALRIFPGDTVETKSVDAGGVDENGVRRALAAIP
jgi:hypothetical protein